MFWAAWCDWLIQPIVHVRQCDLLDQTKMSYTLGSISFITVVTEIVKLCDLMSKKTDFDDRHWRADLISFRSIWHIWFGLRLGTCLYNGFLWHTWRGRWIRQFGSIGFLCCFVSWFYANENSLSSRFFVVFFLS